MTTENYGPWVVVIQDSNGKNYYPDTVYHQLAEAEAAAKAVTKPYQLGVVRRYVFSEQKTAQERKATEETPSSAPLTADEALALGRCLVVEERGVKEFSLTMLTGTSIPHLQATGVDEPFIGITSGRRARRALILWLEGEL